MNLKEKIEKVRDRESFLVFVRLLAADRADEAKKEESAPSSPLGPGVNGWENSTIEDFLESASAWAETSNFGETQGLNADNPWKQFAAFLYAGKIYE